MSAVMLDCCNVDREKAMCHYSWLLLLHFSLFHHGAVCTVTALLFHVLGVMEEDAGAEFCNR